MVNVPLFLILLFVTVVTVKSGSVKAGSLLLGLVLGLALAAIPMGPPIVSAITSCSHGLLSAVSSLDSSR